MRDFLAEPITATITIAAPIERCFFLSTRVELVKETLGMTLVADAKPGYVASGHIVAESRVHWRGWKFGLPTHHHTVITGYAEPHAAKLPELYAEVEGQPVAWFQDSQAKGRFAFFRHDHYFRETISPSTQERGTQLYDEVRFTLPFGALGAMAASVLLAPHIRALCHKRFARLKGLAESEGWREWLGESASRRQVSADLRSR